MKLSSVTVNSASPGARIYKVDFTVLPMGISSEQEPVNSTVITAIIIFLILSISVRFLFILSINIRDSAPDSC